MMGIKLPKVSWSVIAAVGNNPYAKLSVAAPLIAPLALYKSNIAEFFNDYFYLELNTTGLPWLYFSLLFLSAAQFCYNGWSPNEIKEYKTRADYAANGGADLKLYDWEDKAISLLSNFIRNEKSLLNAISELKNFDFIGRGDPGLQKRGEDLIKYIKENKAITREDFGTFRQIISKSYPDLTKNGFPDNIRNEYVHITHLVRPAAYGRNFVDLENDLKELRARWFDCQNLSKPIRRSVVAVFYIFGLSFFVWNIPVNILENVSRLWPF